MCAYASFFACFFLDNTYTNGTMAITKGAKKAHRASLNKRVFNERRKREMRNVLKEITKKVEEKDFKGAEELIPRAYKAIDKSAKRGLIKKNTASRKKARIVSVIKRAGEKKAEKVTKKKVAKKPAVKKPVKKVAKK